MFHITFHVKNNSRHLYINIFTNENNPEKYVQSFVLLSIVHII